MTAPTIITDQDVLERYCRAWRDAGELAFDTEFIRDETFEATLCLVQVAHDDEVLLIDPVAGLDMTPFWELVADPQVAAIVHAGKEDFELCLRAIDRPPRNVFDVQIAAGFVGLGYPLSLSRLVEQTLRKRLRKGQTLTDWLRRPLTEEQIRYALEDVAYLPEIHRKLSSRLRKFKRTAWAREEFRRYEDPRLYIPPPEDKVFKLRGAKKLDALGVATLTRLIAWRERWAEEKNRPIRALIRDDVLVEIAKRRPKKATDLEVLRGFPQARNPKVVNEVLTIIEAAKAMPKEDRPAPHEPREETPMQKAAVDFLSAVSRAICFDEHVSHDLVGSTQRLRELLDFQLGRTQEPPQLLQGWRREFVGQRLVDLLEGRSEAHLTGWPDQLRINLVNHQTSDA